MTSEPFLHTVKMFSSTRKLLNDISHNIKKCKSAITGCVHSLKMLHYTVDTLASYKTIHYALNNAFKTLL